MSSTPEHHVCVELLLRQDADGSFEVVQDTIHVKRILPKYEPSVALTDLKQIFAIRRFLEKWQETVTLHLHRGMFHVVSGTFSGSQQNKAG